MKHGLEHIFSYELHGMNPEWDSDSDSDWEWDWNGNKNTEPEWESGY